jgi:hypothetical protein
MTYSCSDLAEAVTGRLLALNLVTDLDLIDADPQMQAKLCIKAIDTLSNNVTVLSRLLEAALSILPAKTAEPAAAPDAMLKSIDPALAGRITEVLGSDTVRATVHGQGARFMTELRDSNETLTGIAEEHGDRTLADCMYLLSAIQKGTFIEYFHPSHSRILEVVSMLPSSQHWMQYIKQVSK